MWIIILLLLLETKQLKHLQVYLPTTTNQLVPKTYVDSNFVNLTGTQTISGNKDFNASTTTIRGTVLNVYRATTQLFSNYTVIVGSSFF
jgi:hypothetical protein